MSPDYCGDEFYLEDEDFVHAIREKRQPRVGFEEALRVQEFLAALYASMESGNYTRVDQIAEPATR